MIISTPWASAPWHLISLVSILIWVPSPFVGVLVVVAVIVVVIGLIIVIGLVVVVLLILPIAILVLTIPILKGPFLVISISVFFLLLLCPFQS